MSEFASFQKGLNVSRTSLSCAVALVLVVSIAASAAAQTRTASAPSAADLSALLESTSRSVSPSVVQIFATSYTAGDGLVPKSGDLVRTERASGSGVIVDPAGYVITNAHVVRGAGRIRVEVPRPSTGTSILTETADVVGGQIVGMDLETDLAVLKIDREKLVAMAFGDSDELKPGQLVLAFGSPLGLTNSVTLGIVGAVARQLEPESPMVWVQTDASINPGSSGGPLVDLRGRLVGINTSIASMTGGNEGVGFSSPSNIVRAVYEQIKATGHVRRGDIGIRVQTITPALARGLGLGRESGVVVSDVAPGSAAAASGFRPGDIIVSLEGKAMENGRQFQVGLYRRPVGSFVGIDVLRDGETRKARVQIAERRDPLANLSAAVDPRQHLVSRLAILGIDLDAQAGVMLGVQRVPSGVIVASTAAGAIDSRDGGLAPGDIIYAVNTKPVASLAELRSVLDAVKPGDPVVLQLERRGTLMYLAYSAE
jgi:serine protease Do